QAGCGWRVSRVTLFKKLLEKHVFYYNEGERLLNLVARYGIVAGDPRFLLNITEKDEEVAMAFLQRNGLGKSSTIAIAVGANSVKNRWPIGYFEEVVEHFRQSY